MKKILSMLGLVLTSVVQAEQVPCFTPGAYFGLGLGVSTSYNRLSAQNGPDLFAQGGLPGDAAGLPGQKDPYFIYGINNISPSGYGGPGAAVLPELGYTYIVPKSCFAMGVFVNGGIANSAQNAEVPVVVDYYDETKGFLPSAALGKRYWRVSSKGTVGLGVTLGFASGANHIYGIIGWNSISMNVKPRYGTIHVNEVPTSDASATVAVKGVKGNVSGVTFGLGYDRQITKSFSVGGRVMVLNSGGSKGIRLAPANYYPNDLEFNTPVVTVKPFVSTFLFVAKYTFMPKKK